MQTSLGSLWGLIDVVLCEWDPVTEHGGKYSRPDQSARGPIFIPGRQNGIKQHKYVIALTGWSMAHASHASSPDPL